MEPSSARSQLGARQLVAAILQGVFYLSYPFLIYFAHTRWNTRGVGGILLALYAASFLLRVRLRGRMAELRDLARQHAGIAVLIVLAIVLDDRTLLLLLPMGVSLFLLGTFGWSLVKGPPMIQRFAHMVEDDLPPFTFPYCRRVTWIWCVFLACNSVAVAVLAFSAPLEWWALYTGLAFYLLLGVLLGAEFCFRKWWFRYYVGTPADRVFERIFPAENTARGRRSLDYAARRDAAGATP